MASKKKRDYIPRGGTLWLVKDNRLNERKTKSGGV